jgi:hypothetical protein
MPSVSTRKPEDLSPAELRAIVGRVREILWAGGNPDHEWPVETIEDVARVLYDAGLRPAGR